MYCRGRSTTTAKQHESHQKSRLPVTHSHPLDPPLLVFTPLAINIDSPFPRSTFPAFQPWPNHGTTSPNSSASATAAPENPAYLPRLPSPSPPLTPSPANHPPLRRPLHPSPRRNNRRRIRLPPRRRRPPAPFPLPLLAAKTHEALPLGHRRPRNLQVNNALLLPRRQRRIARLRHHAAIDLPLSNELAERPTADCGGGDRRCISRKQN